MCVHNICCSNETHKKQANLFCVSLRLNDKIYHLGYVQTHFKVYSKIYNSLKRCKFQLLHVYESQVYAKQSEIQI